MKPRPATAPESRVYHSQACRHAPWNGKRAAPNMANSCGAARQPQCDFQLRRKEARPECHAHGDGIRNALRVRGYGIGEGRHAVREAFPGNRKTRPAWLRTGFPDKFSFERRNHHRVSNEGQARGVTPRARIAR